MQVKLRQQLANLLSPATEQRQDATLEALFEVANPRTLDRDRPAHQRQLARLAMTVAVHRRRTLHKGPTLALGATYQLRDLFFQEHLDEFLDPLAGHRFQLLPGRP